MVPQHFARLLLELRGVAGQAVAVEVVVARLLDWQA